MSDAQKGLEMMRKGQSAYLRWIAFAGIALLILVSVVFRMPMKEGILGLSVITVCMIMLIYRNFKIEDRRRSSRSRALSKKIEVLESTIRSLDEPRRSLSDKFIRQRQFSSSDDGGAKWDVRSNR